MYVDRLLSFAKVFRGQTKERLFRALKKYYLWQRRGKGYLPFSNSVYTECRLCYSRKKKKIIFNMLIFSMTMRTSNILHSIGVDKTPAYEIKYIFVKTYILLLLDINKWANERWALSDPIAISDVRTDRGTR